MDLKKIQHQSFLKTWFKNTNENINLPYGISVRNEDLRNVYENLLNAYEKNQNHRIVGCDLVSDFRIHLSSKDDLVRIAKMIWESPEKFYNLDGKDPYYDFLKFLWIKSPEFPEFPEETRLTDLINIDEI